MKLFPRVLPLAALAVLGTTGTLNAQNTAVCGTDEVRRAMIAENPDLLRLEAENELGLQALLRSQADLRDDEDTMVYVLPLVFHILYDPTQSTDNHNVSDQRIFDEVAQLNINYSATNSGLGNMCCGYSSLIGNAKIRWELATKDPFGNCTNGIERITSLRSTMAGNFSKLNPWPREHYVNVWVINFFPPMQGGGVLAGFSQFPADVQDDTGYLRDGVIMLASSLTQGNSEGTTLTHELGHYLDLMHVWGNDNNPGVACGDDGVDDTPDTKGHNSCSSPDNLYDSFCNSTALDGVYTFAGMTTSSGTQDPTPAPELVYPPDSTGVSAVTFSAFNATGVSNNSAVAQEFAFTEWATGAMDGDSMYTDLTGSLNTGQYYQFTITPILGYSMPVTGLTFKVKRSEDGPRTFAVRSSANNYGTNLAAAISGNDTLVLGIPEGNVFFFLEDTASDWATARINVSYVNRVDPVTFRIYAWNAEDANGYFSVGDVKVIGKYGRIENLQNYMEYAHCSNQMFTKGQVARMRGTLQMSTSGRNNLWSPANHVFTGINGNQVGCAPEADFYTRTPFVCANTSVQFKANVKRATATSWEWTFEGGTPATSTAENPPVVTFSEPGTHAVTLTVSNALGSNTITKHDAVHIGANYTELAHGLEEPFNNFTDFDRWSLENIEGNNSRWYWTNETGHYGIGCAKLNASQTYTMVQDLFSSPTEYLHDIDNLITPSLALNFHKNVSVNFWYAYSTQASAADDVTEQLKVFVSNNCGRAWNLRLTLSGGQLVTGGSHSAGYVPAANEWRQGTFTIPDQWVGENLRIKFEFTSGLLANDLFIDDLQITSTNVGIEEAGQNGYLGLWPNPATNSVTVQMDLAGASNGTLSFLDLTGRVVMEQTVHAGMDELELDLGHMGLGSGVYLVRLKHDNGQRVERLVVR